MNVFIVDDEKSARGVLKHHLAKFPFVNVVGESGSIDEAIETIKESTIDLLFLDISMPGGSGFDVLDSFSERSFQVVFVTAHSEYSIRAIRSGAFDYILKPVLIEELEACLTRVQKNINKVDDVQVTSHSSERILIQEKGKIKVVKKENVIRVESGGNYSTIYLDNSSKIIISKNMKRIEEDLFPLLPFVRVHQSHLVNLNYVQELVLSDGFIFLDDSSRIPLSRSRKDHFLEVLSNN